MNCSCSARDCPHIRYIRRLLESTEIDQLKTEEDMTATGWKYYLPHARKAATYVVTTLQIIFYFWFSMTKAALQMWLCVLNSNSFFWLGFLAFTSALICSLPQVRAQPLSLENGLFAEDETTAMQHGPDTALMEIRQL